MSEMTDALALADRVEELAGQTLAATDGDTLSRMSNGQRISVECAEFIRDHGATIAARLRGEAAQLAAPAPVAGDAVAGYGLTDEQIATLLSACLKPEEISGDPAIQHARVGELVHWFARFARGMANPKWAAAHASELAFFIATSGGNRQIDLDTVRHDAFKRGAMITPTERESLEIVGFLKPSPALAQDRASQAGAQPPDVGVDVSDEMAGGFDEWWRTHKRHDSAKRAAKAAWTAALRTGGGA